MSKKTSPHKASCDNCSVAKLCPMLWPHELQHIRLPCLSLSPRVCSNSCPLSWWCHPTISFSVAPFFFCPQSFPASGSFPVGQLFISVAKYWSFSISISPSNEYSALIYFSIDWFDLLALQGALKCLLQHHNLKASNHWCSVFLMVQLSQLYMNTGKTIALTVQTSVSKVVSLLFNTLSRLVTAFLARSKCPLISWLQSTSAVILEPKNIKSAIFSLFPHLFVTVCHDLHFLNVEF